MAAEVKEEIKIPEVVPAQGEIQTKAHTLVIAKWGEGEWPAFYKLVMQESGWHYNSVNSSSGASGLFQALPWSKTGCSSFENVDCQLNWGLGYIQDRYGSPSRAWAWHLDHGWY